MNEGLQLLDSVQKELVASVQRHPFLCRCRTGTASLAQLTLFLVQQGLYSRHFTRYLCAMMSNLKDNREILALGENLFEELGLGNAGDVPHSIIYQRMLNHFGLSLNRDAKPLAGTTLLINAMFEHCRDPNPARGLGALCLGAEALVPAVYSDILCGFTSLGIAPEHMEFFRIHIECDDDHAETMRRIMLGMTAQDPSQLDVLVKAGQALVNARLAFFDDIDACETQSACSGNNSYRLEGGIGG